MQSMEGVEGDPQWGAFNNQALQKSEEELADEEEDDKPILQVALHPPPFSTALKMNFPELCRKFRYLNLFVLLFRYRMFMPTLLESSSQPALFLLTLKFSTLCPFVAAMYGDSFVTAF